ncbi:hypothetical protein PHLCEN_2v9710 [Hermanssonia centrifuga]|uniref:NAD(P)-binding protein n=1 Tax=Hermanssonia centrifuga TaxID=98765 RepID=A0A2R6NPX2_9APHY|nr:hypothetical protein PHLCEN_2v9710 [Hermanssonia centrifuga]
MSVRPVYIIAGVGNGTGTGAATARLFAKAGYRVALVARNADHLSNTAKDIVAAGGEAAAFPVKEYNYSAVLDVFNTIKQHKWSSSQEPAEIRGAVWNAGAGVFKNFLDVSEEELQQSIDANITAAFAFSRGAILAFRENPIDNLGKRGTIIFTGATASIRGNVLTSAFAAGKFALRALSQSLAKEFGKENIHAIIDGGILTDRSAERRIGEAREEFKTNQDIRLSPESIAQSALHMRSGERTLGEAEKEMPSGWLCSITGPKSKHV